jgi:2-keto-3-deoxy-L-rhamnonate aldolase RhmA
VPVAPRPELWAQVESAAGVAAAGAIAAHADAVVVGAADLSFALGVPHDLAAPAVAEAVAAVRAACGRAGVPFGLAGPLDAAPPALLAGAAVLVHATDARLCAAAVDDAAAWLRATPGSAGG